MPLHRTDAGSRALAALTLAFAFALVSIGSWTTAEEVLQSSWERQGADRTALTGAFSNESWVLVSVEGDVVIDHLGGTDTMMLTPQLVHDWVSDQRDPATFDTWTVTTAKACDASERPLSEAQLLACPFASEVVEPRTPQPGATEEVDA